MGKNVIISTLPNISQNYLPKVNTSNIFANSLVYDDGSSVLINTTTASAFKLDVNGTARTGALTLTGALSGTSATFSGNLETQTNGNSPQFRIKDTDYTGQGAYAYMQVQNGSLYIGNATDTFASLSDKLIISSTGAATFSSSVTATTAALSSSLNGDPGLATFTNDSSGSTAEATIYVRNGSTSNDATFIQALGTAFTTTGGFVQDGGTIGTGTGLSGGLSLIVRANADMRFYTNGHTNQRMIITSGGNVGIGTTSPSYKLDINPSTYNRIASYFSGTYISGFKFSDLNGSIYYDAAADMLTLGSDYVNGKINFTTAGAERMRITSGGNVYIGSTSGDYGKLDVTVSPSSYTAALGLGVQTNSSEGNSVGISFKTKISLSGAIWENARIAVFTDGVTSSAYGSMAFYTMNATTLTERMRITSGGTLQVKPGTTGGVEIGTSTTAFPTYLSIVNDGNTSGVVVAQARSAGHFLTSASAGDMIIGASTSQKILFGNTQTGTTEYMRITSGGNVLIGTTTDGGFKTYIVGTNGVLISAGSSSSNNSFFVQNQAENSTYFKIRGDGYIYAPQIYVNTTATAANVVVTSGGDLIRSTSSVKYKKNVVDYTKGLAEVMNLRPVNYQGKNEIDGNKVFAGLIAEEVHDAGLTEFVQYAEDGSPDALAYQNMIALLVKGMQEQQAQIEEQKADIESLKALINK